MFDATQPNRPTRRRRTRRGNNNYPDRRHLPDPAPQAYYPDAGYYPDDQPTVPAPNPYDSQQGYEQAQGRRVPVRRVRRRRDQEQAQRRKGLLGGYTPKAIAVGSVAGLFAFALLGVMIVVGTYLYFQIFELILPGVYVGDVRVGAMSRTDAAIKLSQAWGSGQGVIISDGTENWVASPADFGMTLDPAATAQRAYDVGHGGAFVDEFMTLFDSTLNGTAVPPMVSFDEAQARAGLEGWADELNKPPVDASIAIENGQVRAVPGEQGYNLNVEATVRVLAADPAYAIQDGYLPLVLDPIAPRITDASGAVAEAQALLDAPLEVRAYDPITDEALSWSVPPVTIAAWLGVETNETGPHAVVQAERLTAWVSEINTGLGGATTINAEESAPELEAALRENRSAVVSVKHGPTAYTVEAGDTLTRIAWKTGMPYWRILDANPGLEPDTLSPGQVLTIPSKDVLLPLPVVAHKRIRVDISDQHLWAYENGVEVYSFVISTGIDRSPTQPGIFQVQDHDLSVYAAQWDLTMPHFISIYESWPGFFNGFHGLPTLSNGQLLWREVLGRPASYGCIILDLDDGETLYNWAEDGVVVEITE